MDHPASYLSWDDAAEFCRRLSDREGKSYRLPTEAEWEYACRSGSTSGYCFGSDMAGLDQYAWYELGNGRGHPQQVALKRANGFGLYDMHGNVAECCSDWYQELLSVSVTDPQGPTTGSLRIFRGGCRGLGAEYCRASYRLRTTPSNRNGGWGFRVAQGLIPPK